MVLNNHQVTELMIAAIEGGSNYWCERVDAVDYADPSFWAGNFEVAVITTEDGPADFLLTPERLAAAFALLPDHHRQDIINDNIDAETADAFLQIAALGEITYG